MKNKWLKLGKITFVLIIFQSLFGCSDSQSKTSDDSNGVNETTARKVKFGSWKLLKDIDDLGDESRDYTIYNKNLKGIVYNNGNTYKTDVNISIGLKKDGFQEVRLTYDDHVKMGSDGGGRPVTLKDYKLKTKENIRGRGFDKFLVFEGFNANVLVDKIRENTKIELVADIELDSEGLYYVSVEIDAPHYAEIEKTVTSNAETKLSHEKSEKVHEVSN